MKNQLFLSDLSQATGLSTSYLRRLIRKGRIAARRVPQGGRTFAYMVPREELRRIQKGGFDGF